MNKVSTLFRFLKSHNYDGFYNLLEDNDDIDVNYQDDNGNYLIQYAILFNKKELVTLLINRGARLDVTDFDGRSIIYTAVKYNYIEILDLLLHFNNINIGVSLIDIQDKLGNIPLHYGIFSKNVKACQMLIDEKSDTNLSDKKGNTALHLAIYSKQIEIIEMVLNTNINVNARTKLGETALHLACNFQLIEIVKILLNKKANPNVQDYDHELTPLNYSINLGNIEITKILLYHDADVGIQDLYGNSSIHYAIMEDNYEIFEYVINSKTFDKKYLSYQNLNGYTPLHMTIYNNSKYQKEIIEMIIDDTDLNTQDNQGNTVVHLLIIFGLWQKYFDFLKEKKINIFIKNFDGQRVIDLVPLAEKDNFLSLIVDNYLYLLKTKNKKWQHEWENLCKTSVQLINLTPEQKKIFSSMIPHINLHNRSNDLCRDFINQLLHKEINTHCCPQYSYPIDKNKKEIKINNGTKVTYCTYSGISLDILIGMIHLVQKHKNLRIPITKDFINNPHLKKRYDELGFSVNPDTDFLNFEIVWIHGKIYFPTFFNTEMTKLLNDDTVRFIAIPLGIQISTGSHANFLLYDKTTNELERFEPYGSNPPYQFKYNPELLDEIINSKFSGIISELKYVPPKKYLPKIGFQYLDTNDRKNKKIGDPGGFCAIWTIWYIDLRVSHNDISRKSLIDKTIKHIKLHNLSFKNLIRNYTYHVVLLRDEYLSKANIDINDWINDNISSKQALTIVQELQKNIVLISSSSVSPNFLTSKISRQLLSLSSLLIDEE
jgi:ankyrin repeat protein